MWWSLASDGVRAGRRGLRLRWCSKVFPSTVRALERSAAPAGKGRDASWLTRARVISRSPTCSSKSLR